YFVWVNTHLLLIGSVFAVTLICWGLHAWVVSPSPWLAYLFNGKPLAESPWLGLRKALGLEGSMSAKQARPAWHRAGTSVRELGQAGLVRAQSLAPKHRVESYMDEVNSRTTAANSSGISIIGIWPISSKIRMRDPGINCSKMSALW